MEGDGRGWGSSEREEGWAEEISAIPAVGRARASVTVPEYQFLSLLKTRPRGHPRSCSQCRLPDCLTGEERGQFCRTSKRDSISSNLLRPCIICLILNPESDTNVLARREGCCSPRPGRRRIRRLHSKLTEREEEEEEEEEKGLFKASAVNEEDPEEEKRT